MDLSVVDRTPGGSVRSLPLVHPVSGNLVDPDFFPFLIHHVGGTLNSSSSCTYTASAYLARAVVPAWPSAPAMSRFVQFEDWFLSRRHERVSEHFYTVLQEDFYNAYLNSGVAFRSQRAFSLESLVAAAGKQIRPHLSYLPGLIDLLRWTGWYVPSWVCEIYSSLWIDPRHRFIHFAFRGRDYRL